MGSGSWETPDYFFDRCNAVWGPFGLDAAADADNTKCADYLGLGATEDGLTDPWGFSEVSDAVWLNPPYKNLLAWVNKAIQESNGGLRVVMLLPANVETRWYQKLLIRAEIYTVVGRIKFIDPEPTDRQRPLGANIVAVLHPTVEGVKRNCGVCGTIMARE